MVSTHLKNISQIGSFPQIVMKIENIWNHHLVVDESQTITAVFFLAPRERSAPSGLKFNRGSCSLHLNLDRLLEGLKAEHEEGLYIYLKYSVVHVYTKIMSYHYRFSCMYIIYTCACIHNVFTGIWFDWLATSSYFQSSVSSSHGVFLVAEHVPGTLNNQIS